MAAKVWNYKEDPERGDIFDAPDVNDLKDTLDDHAALLDQQGQGAQTQGQAIDGLQQKNTEQDSRLDAVEAKDAAQDSRLDAVEAKDTAQDSRLDAVEAKDTAQDSRLDAVEAKDTAQDSRLDAVEAKDTAQDSRLDAVEAKDTAQDSRLDAVEAKDTAQDAALDNVVQQVNQKNAHQDQALANHISASDTKNAAQDQTISAIQQKNAEQEQALAKRFEPQQHNFRYASLLANGLAQEETNYNFPGSEFVRDPRALSDGVLGAFEYPRANYKCDEPIPVNASADAIEAGLTACKSPGLADSQYFAFLDCLDRQKRQILPYHHMFTDGAFAELAEPASASDTVLKVGDASGFQLDVPWYFRRLAFADYKDEDGVLYPGFKNYTRFVTGDSNFIESVDTSTSPHKITLSGPLGMSPNGAAVWEVGQKLRQARDGNTYKYTVAQNKLVDQTPKRASGVMAGVDETGTNKLNKFSPGTAFIKLGLLASNDGDPGKMLIWGCYVRRLPLIQQNGDAYYLDRDPANGEVIWKQL